MATLLKVMVIVLLVLSLVALGMGIKLFSQRVELKGRTQTLENNVLALSKTIEAKDGEDLVTRGQPTMDNEINAQQLMTYYGKDAMGKRVAGGPGTMEIPLGTLLGRAQSQYNRLNDTRVDLDTTRTTLATTKAEKERVENELVAEKKITKEQGEKIEQQTKEIADKTTQIADLETKNTGLQQTVDDQTKEIGKLTEDLKDRDAKIKAQDNRIAQLNRQIETMTPAVDGRTKSIPPGYKGQVLIVNPDWNFVVLGLVPAGDVVPNVDLIVHRDESFIGKIRVSEIKSEFNIAVAEILPDWSKGDIQEGDYVIF